MKNSSRFSRRLMMKSTLFGLLYAGSAPFGFPVSRRPSGREGILSEKPYPSYPAIPPDIVSEVVGVSHFNLDRLKALLDPRPELAKCSWDWGFSDVESALGAASHVGRKDIAEYLISKGAAPTIFTYAMLGALEAVKSMITHTPGLHQQTGPHGISLRQHVVNGRDSGAAGKEDAARLLEYLDELGHADGPDYLQTTEAEKQQYLGDYRYGEGEEDGFTISLNGRKLLSLGKLGKKGGTLLQLGPQEYTYNGAPSVRVIFEVDGNRVISLTVQEPGFSLRAMKV